MTQNHPFLPHLLILLIILMPYLVPMISVETAYGQKAAQESKDVAAALKAQADRMNQEAIALAGKEDLNGAIEKFKHAYELYVRAQDRHGQAKTLNNVGQGYYSMGQQYKEQALDYQNRALSLWREMGDRAGEGKTLASIGLIYFQSDESGKALEFLERALPLLPEDWKGNKEGSLLNAIGISYDLLSEKQKALDAFLRALPILRAANNQTQVAGVTEYIAMIYNFMDDKPRALDYAKQARQLWHAIPDHVREAGSLKLMGIVSEKIGNYKDALSYFSEALSLLSAPDDRPRQAELLNYLGTFYNALGDYQRSLRYNQQALALWRAAANRAKEAATLASMSQSYRMVGKSELAFDSLSEAYQAFKESGDRQGEMNALYYLGLIYEDGGRHREAIENLKLTLQLARSLGDRVREATALRKIGMIYSLLGDKQNALDNLRQAIALSEAVADPELRAALFSHIALVYILLENYRLALDYLERALSFYRGTKDNQWISNSLGTIAFVHESQGNIQRALALYREAIKIREEMRTAARLEELQTGVAGQAVNIYQNAIRLLMRLHQSAQAFDLSERARARNFLDQLSNPRIDMRKGADSHLIEQEQTLLIQLNDLVKRLREERSQPRVNSVSIQSLEEQLLTKQQEYAHLLTRIRAVNPEYDSLRSVNPLTLAEVQRLLDKDTTLVSYFVTIEQTLAFLITRDSFQSLVIPVGEQELEKAVISFHDSRSNLNEPSPQILKKLYTKLLTPLKPYLKSRVIGIIPHGILHYLPFAALNDGQSFFGDNHTLFYLPSASVLPFIQKKRKPGEQTLLALAQGQAEALPTLEYANQSAEAISKLYNTTALVNSAATESAFRSRANQSGILFLAAHGTLSQVNPLFSRIVLAPDKENDGLLEVHEVYSLDLIKSNLVVLSGCQTQLGERSQGDDFVGLNRAFIYAGTPTVVASLWSVKEKQTSELMYSFFKHLKDGLGKAEALQAAQREMRANYPNPYYWAAFVLTGEP
jgi:CHAT domain-containing protein